VPRGALVRLFLAGALVTGLLSVVQTATADSTRSAAPSQRDHHRLLVRGSVRQVYATGLPRAAQVGLLRAGHRIRTKRADSLGGVVFYRVRPGRRYRVKVLPHGAVSKAVTVHPGRATPWDPAIYRQAIPDKGYGYLTTRDGTRLAIDVHPPTSPAGLGLPDVTLPPGVPDYAPPYPTLIEYSGYGYADPSGPENGIGILANLMGFAVVDVNMRGTGCSGGAYNFFERLQNLDGYDVIETIAHQPWVRDHKVGMMGISFGAISQLFTAPTHPPALEAISPLSTIDAAATILYPGGILNTGFTIPWVLERQQNAEPAGPHGGQAWAYERVQQGDRVCRRNQVLHGEAQDLLAKVRANTSYHPKVADPLDPITFVHKIHVPVFLACQWEDEETGGHCPDLAQHFSGTRQKWFTFTNGVHTDPLDPATFNRWYDFLSLYVAHRAPMLNSAVIRAVAPIIFQQAFGLKTFDTLPADPIQSIPTYRAARAVFRKLPSIRILFDNGAGISPTGKFHAGDPYAGFERSFSRFPIPHTRAVRWFLGPKGRLTTRPATRRGVDRYTADARAVPLTDYVGNTGTGGLWGNASQWTWRWRRNPAGTAVSYLSPRLQRDVVVVGAGAVHLWLRASAPDVDLQATVSEVDPGVPRKEVFVQNGWIRASDRALAVGRHNILAQRSTLLAPVPSFRAATMRPLPRGRFTRVVIPLFYEGHVYRKGTRIRITIAAPNGDQPIWSFSKTVPKRTAEVFVAHSRRMRSSLILPVVPHVSVPTGIPPCPSLRNEPCRIYRPVRNRG
jgi:predicted acyl esterase